MKLALLACFALLAAPPLARASSAHPLGGGASLLPDGGPEAPKLQLAPTAELGAQLLPAAQLTAPADTHGTAVGLGALALVGALGFGVAVSNPTAPSALAPEDDEDGDGIPDVTRPASTPPWRDKKFWAALFTVLGPVILKFTGIPIDPNLLAIVFAGVGLWYMQLHNSKSKAIELANIQHQAEVTKAYFAAQVKTPEDAAAGMAEMQKPAPQTSIASGA